jgi:hypothetical protein
MFGHLGEVYVFVPTQDGSEIGQWIEDVWLSQESA